MIKIGNYLQDGADAQSQAVLAMLKQNPDIEDSWNSENKYYEAIINLGRWSNCREQGYIVSLRNSNHKKLNIAFFEHRNSDSIVAIKWVQCSMNMITIETAKFPEGVYGDKWELEYSVGYGEIVKMAEWIKSELVKHWNKGK